MGRSREIEESIQRARGGGQPLDQGVRRQMESTFGGGLDHVRVHTDAQSDTLNRALSARAFTVGSDIFFRQGAYNPGASSGRELIAHETTHVVQQGNGQVRTKLAVNQPGDKYEQEADAVAKSVIQAEHIGGANGGRPGCRRTPGGGGRGRDSASATSASAGGGGREDFRKRNANVNQRKRRVAGRRNRLLALAWV